MPQPTAVNESVHPHRQGFRRALIVRCVECKQLSDHRWRGWGAYRIEDPEGDDPAELAFYCPECRREQFSTA